jgi:predicted nucleotidyltransferase component of viral defense system
MDRVLKFSPNDRRAAFLNAEEAARLPSVTIEKDFWVCWTLRELFRVPEWGGHLTFKGGTSLSKCWKLIERFSEDIDIVIDRDFLGFGGAQSPAAAPSNKQKVRRLESLKAICRGQIHASLHPILEAQLRAALPAGEKWSLAIADAHEDPDQQTLLFYYPTALADATGYVKRVVKIELGARSDTEPSETVTIQPYLHEALERVLGSGTCDVRVVAARRTFWEKAMLLHEETYRPAGKPRKARLARHYYDLWCLILKGVAKDAAADTALFDRIVEHRTTFFRQNWVDYATLRRGTLRLVPTTAQMADWRRDYESMRGEMFFGKVPTFDDIIRVVGAFESEFNQGTATATQAPS